MSARKKSLFIQRIVCFLVCTFCQFELDTIDEKFIFTYCACTFMELTCVCMVAKNFVEFCNIRYIFKIHYKYEKIIFDRQKSLNIIRVGFYFPMNYEKPRLILCLRFFHWAMKSFFLIVPINTNSFTVKPLKLFFRDKNVHENE